MSASERPYQGESAETRASARRRRLLDAGFEQMAAQGWRQATIEALCRRARLNKRYFYESFPDLDAVAAAVIDELAAMLLSIGLTAAHEAQRAGLGTEALARSVMRVVIGWLVEDRRRARVLFSEVGDNPRAQSHRKAAIRHMARELSAFGHEFHGADSHQPIAQAAAALLVGGTIEALVSWFDGDVTLTIDELAHDIAGFWVAVGAAAVEIAGARALARAPQTSGDRRRARTDAPPPPSRVRATPMRERRSHRSR